MEIYMTTLPIFDNSRKVFAYELCYKINDTSSETLDEDKATAKVIMEGFHTTGFEKLTGGKPAFINFTESLLKLDFATYLPPKQLYIEILQPISMNEDVLECIKTLQQSGYNIVFGDYVMKTEYSSFINLAKMIKVDFTTGEVDVKHKIAKSLSERGITMLAASVETLDSFAAAQTFGYSLFQGFFFCQPEILALKEIPALKINYLQLIKKVNEPDINFEEISPIISRDLALSYKLLKLVNSIAFNLRNKVENIKQALVVMGQKELRKWISLISISGISSQKTEEVIRVGLIRARFSELLSLKTTMSGRSQDLFLIGMFSILDVIMDRQLKDILEEVQLGFDIKIALIGRKGNLANVFNLVLAYEKGEWEKIDELGALLGLSKDYILKSYVDATEWSNLISQT